VRVHRFIRRLMAGAVVLVIISAAVLSGAAANAAPPPNDGPLILTPATGTDTTSFALVTPAGCPPAANAYNGLVKGPNGFDGTVVNTLSDKISFTGPFTVGFSNTMLAVSQFIRKPIVAGEYDIFLNCVDDFTGQVFRSFTTAMYFTDATHYTLAAVPGATSDGATATSATGANGIAGGSTLPGAPVQADPLASSGPGTETGPPLGFIFLGGSTLFVAGLAALLVWRQRLRKVVLGDGRRHSR
jgi:hypothetical protein